MSDIFQRPMAWWEDLGQFNRASEPGGIATAMAKADGASPLGEDQPDDVYLMQNAGTIYTPYDTIAGDTDQAIDALIYPYSWDTTVLTYAFPNSIEDYNYSPIGDFAPLVGDMQPMIESVLGQFASIAPFTFTELTGEADSEADLAFALDPIISSAYAYLPGNGTSAGDGWFGWHLTDPITPSVGSFDYHTMLHEVGHSLGLVHGHDPNYGGVLPYEMNSMEFSVMTYSSYIGSPGGAYTNSDGDFAQSLMMLDIAAIQRMYGADFTANEGDTVYSFSTETGAMLVNGVDVIQAAGLSTYSGSDTIFRTIWDGDGNDTYDFSNYSTSIGVDLRPGEWVDLDIDGTVQRAHLGAGNFARGHIANALQHEGDARSLIENARGGSGDDWFIGNEADNTFWGGAGDDLFYDGAGSDSYHGDEGIDTVEFQSSFASFAFAISDGFVQAIGDAIDQIADNVEWIKFSDGTWSWDALVEWIGGGTTNSAPLPVDDQASTDEGMEIVIDVLANDSDPDGDTVVISDFTQPQNGTVTLSGASLIYTPAAGFSGADSFTYSVGDGSELIRTATVNVTVDAAAQQLLAIDELVTFESGIGADASQGLAFESLDIVESEDISGRYLAETGDDGLIEIYGTGEDFDVNSLMFVSERGSAAVTLEAWDDGVLVDEVSLQVNSRTSQLEELGEGFGSVDRVVIASDRNVFVDDIDATTYWIEDPGPMQAPPNAILVDFEEFDANGNPNNSGLMFENAVITSNATGVVSGQSAVQTQTGTMSISGADGQGFALDSGWFTAIDGKNINLTLEAWRDGELLGSQNLKVSDNREKFFELDNGLFSDVDNVKIQSDDEVIIDDLEFWL